jgi:hypothetical protein
MLKFTLPIDNEIKEFDLNKIYTVDYSSQESIIKSTQKVNSWYGYFIRLLPEIILERDIISGSITELKRTLKETRAEAFIRYKLGKEGEKPLSDKLADAYTEIDPKVKLVEEGLLKRQESLSRKNREIGIVEGIIKTLNHIEEQIKGMLYIRKLEFKEEEKMNIQEKLAERMTRKEEQ